MSKNDHGHYDERRPEPFEESDSESDTSQSVSADDGDIPTGKSSFSTAFWICEHCSQQNSLSDAKCVGCNQYMESAVDYDDKPNRDDYKSFEFRNLTVKQFRDTWQNLAAVACESDDDMPTSAYKTALQQVRQAQKEIKEHPERDFFLDEANELEAFAIQFKMRIEDGSEDDEDDVEPQPRKKKRKHGKKALAIWHCSNCDFANHKRDSVCDRCGDLPPVKSNQWRCESCTTVNNVKFMKCSSCKCKRFNPTEPWTCGNCGAINPPEQSKTCGTCHQDPRKVEKTHMANKRKAEKKKKKRGKKKQQNVVFVRVEAPVQQRPENRGLNEAKQRYAARDQERRNRPPPRVRLDYGGSSRNDRYDRVERYGPRRHSGRDDRGYNRNGRSHDDHGYNRRYDERRDWRDNDRDSPPRGFRSRERRDDRFDRPRGSPRRRTPSPEFRRRTPSPRRDSRPNNRRGFRQSPPRRRMSSEERQQDRPPPPRRGFGRQEGSHSPPRRGSPGSNRSHRSGFDSTRPARFPDTNNRHEDRRRDDRRSGSDRHLVVDDLFESDDPR